MATTIPQTTPHFALNPPVKAKYSTQPSTINPFLPRPPQDSRLTNRHTPITLNSPHLSPHQLPPNRTRNRTHPLRTSRHQNIFAQVPDPINRRNNGCRSRSEEFDECPVLRGGFDFGHGDGAFGDGEVGGEAGEGGGGGGVCAGEGEDGVAGDTWEDHTV